MDHKWIEDIEEFRKISGEWDEAVVNSGSCDVFLLSDFIITWWRYFGQDNRLRIFVISSDGKITAGIPLYTRRAPGVYNFARTLNYAGGPAASYTEPLYTSAETLFLPILIEGLKERRDWDALYLPDVRHESRLISEAQKYTANGILDLRLVQDHMNWAIDLSGGTEKYLAALSGKMKRDLRSKRQRLEKECGPVALRPIVDEEDVKRYFDLYIQFSCRAFAERERRSTLGDSKYSSFLKEFLIIMSRNKRLDGHLLMAGDKIMALSFGYRFGKGFNWALTGFNYEYKYYRPGYLLIEELVKEISRRGDSYYNWYGHERFYKTQWCNSQAPLYRLFLARNTLRGRCYRALNDIETKVRSNKFVVETVRKIKRA